MTLQFKLLAAAGGTVLVLVTGLYLLPYSSQEKILFGSTQDSIH